MASSASDQAGSTAIPGEAADPGPPAELPILLDVALAAMRAGTASRSGPAPTGAPDELAAGWVDQLRTLLPATGVGAAAALNELVEAFAAGSVDPADPRCAAHLHTPPLAVAVAADTVASALNPSLDSWDQAPFGTALEPALIAELAALVGFDRRRAGGVVTTGGSESNLLGLLLAREHAVRAASGVSAVRNGIPAVLAGKGRIFASAVAHFSVHRAAGLLGFGEDAVVPVGTSAAHRMHSAALDVALSAARKAGELPIAVVATAGTTDLGAIDPLPELAEVAAAHGVWLHVDAAYGGGALFSSTLAGLLRGLGQADSVGLDLHKLGWQPVAAGVFLTRDQGSLDALARRAEYLNPEDDEDAGYTSLLGRSLRTTRRPDALKIAVTLRALGRAGLGALVDRCHALARHAARRVDAEPTLELCQQPILTTVVFRYQGADAVNARLRRALLADGEAVIGRTEIDGRVWLKLTLLNPDATEADVDALLTAVLAAGAKIVAAGAKEADRDR